jgi:hypothetical protein
MYQSRSELFGSPSPPLLYAGECGRSISEAFREACSRSSRALACCRGDEEAPLLPEDGESGVKFAKAGDGRGGVLECMALVARIRLIKEMPRMYELARDVP